MMPRTTLDLDTSVLREVKRIARATGRSIGDVVSELVAVALGRTDRSEHRLSWTTKAMDARIDLEDKDALHRALDGR